MNKLKLDIHTCLTNESNLTKAGFGSSSLVNRFEKEFVNELFYQVCLEFVSNINLVWLHL